MIRSKRNPVNKINKKELDEVVGNLGLEIKDQDLESTNGGSTPGCVIVSLASSWGCAAVSVAATAVSYEGGKWVNDKVTAKYDCGRVATATAECQGC